jgi:serine/threonine protein kinase
MAPEQARGRAVDRRADIWAFGNVVYELLTGRRALEGEDVARGVDIRLAKLYLRGMTLPIKPERLAELEEFARRRGKTPADALDEALAEYLEWERQDYQEAVQAVQQGVEDVKAGRTKAADEFLDEFARKHGLPR